VFGVTQTDNFQYQNQIVDIDNLTRREQRKNVLITDKNWTMTLGLRVRAVLISAVYRKVSTMKLV
jgi:hypothetical protein